MASRQNYSSQVLNSQSTANSANTTNAKEKSSHTKPESKLKHDKSSSAASGHIPMSSNTIINNMSKRKGQTSFQITSVSVSANAHHQQQSAQQGQRNSTDNNNDYETPSISETFSNEDVFYTQPIAFGTAPVIPTSSQYGLAIVGPDLVGGDGANLTDVHVSVTDAGINIMGGPISGGKQDGVDHKNERFKVVKIESTEPFKRGRWMCMDYLDHTTLQDDGIDGKEGEEGGTATTTTTTKDDDNSSAGAKQQILLGINNGVDVDHVQSDNEELDHEVNRINSNNNNNNIDSTHPHHNPHHHASHNHPQTLTTIPNYSSDHHSSSSNFINNNNQVAQSMPQGQIQMILNQEKLTPQDNAADISLAAGAAVTLTGNPSAAAASNNNNGAQVEQANGGTSQYPNANVAQTHYVIDQQQQQHAQTMNQEMIHKMMYQDQNSQQQQQQQQNYHQGVTLPTNILMQNIGGALSLDPQQSHTPQQINSPSGSSSNNALPTNVTIPSISTESAGAVGGENVENSNSNANQDAGGESEQAGVSLGANETINNSSDNNNNITISNDGAQQNPASSEGGAGEISESASSSVNSNNATVGAADDGQAISGEDNDSASGTSAVAIDNKIEQAMDLVKSHLMFAVREEVEVLKERIAELMDRINQLEVENTILKANASQETLSQLTTAAVAISPQTQQPAATQQQQQSASPQVPAPPSSNEKSLPQQLISAPSQPQATMTQAAQVASPNTQTQPTS